MQSQRNTLNTGPPRAAVRQRALSAGRAVANVIASVGGSAEHDAGVEIGFPPTKRHGTSASAHASMTSPSRSRGGIGIVTRTVSGRV